jgi:RHS repeat-associated protein
MLVTKTGEADSKEAAHDKTSWSAPSISLPKGGGAIRGIGEKFAANPVTGTGSMTVPIPTSPGRSGFGPDLSLSYDSGSGNGPFGLGWNISLPSITRKTDKGLPRYQEAEESDVYILSGAEDLVPVFKRDSQGNWVRDDKGDLVVHDDPRTIGVVTTYRVSRYRPRIEGLFARIERWTNVADAKDVFWRSISKDNVTTWYGKTTESRIADPADRTRIFSWLICESYDDKGNVISYKYKSEDDPTADVLAQAHERNRTPQTRSANSYLERIRYGNHIPYFPKLDANSPWPVLPADDQWFFEIIFDYGEYDANAPTPLATGTWAVRNDPFSSYRSGFEIRTYRLCQRILTFHHFPDEAQVGTDCLVRSTDFTYSYEKDSADTRNPIFSQILSVTQSGYKRQPNGGYITKSFPSVEFSYSKAIIQEEIHEVEDESLENLPSGLDGSQYQWADLDGEGLSGILSEQGDGWFYKRNLSPVPVRTNGSESIKARFAPIELVASKPAVALSAGQAQFLDLAGDGQLDLVTFEGTVPGFYERTEDADWEPFRPFVSWPNLDTRDPHLKFIDVDGDGHSDILISDDEVFRWHPSLAEDGFGLEERARQFRDEEEGPRLVFADPEQTIYLADMSADGLTDLVRIRNGEICYWPNLGYGRFGAKVSMDRAPWFDSNDLFDQRRVRLADIDGSGTTDILYLGSGGVHIYFNQSGNSWSPPTILSSFPWIDDLSSVSAFDLLGNGTACLVWSSSLPGDAGRQMRYLDLMGGQKPHLLIETVNNLGAETHVGYAPSTKFYLLDKQKGTPWITKLPFPVHVVERVETWDHVSRNLFVTSYTYSHGYFDGVEREFRGFGKVEQLDTEEFAALNESPLPIGAGERQQGGGPAANVSQVSHVPPVRAVTWFHTGAWADEKTISQHLAHEYFGAPDESDQDFEKKWPEFEAMLLPDTVLPEDIRLPDGTRLPLSADEQREAVRALKGGILRQEVYAEDGSDKEHLPYSVSERNYTIECLQPRASNRHAVFFAHARETIDYHHERKLFPILNGQIVGAAAAAANPEAQWLGDPRVTHNAVLEVDPFGNVLKAVAIGYGRHFSSAGLEPGGIDLSIDPSTLSHSEQHTTLLTLTESKFTNKPNEPDWYRVGVPVETRTYELTRPPRGPNGTDDWSVYTFAELTELGVQAAPIDYEVQPVATQIRKRLIEHVRTFYRPDDLGADGDNVQALLSLGEVQSLALPGESYKLAFTPGLLVQIYKRKFDNGSEENLLPDPVTVLRGEGGYVLSDDQKALGVFPASDPSGYWWIPSGRSFYSRNPSATVNDEFTEATAHFFLPRRFKDPFGNIVFVDYAKDLLLAGTEDAHKNKVVAENNYRVLQPHLVIDPNGNRSEIAFDALGMVAGTALRGKATESLGDTLTGFDPDPTPAPLDAFYDAADPRVPAVDLLKGATTRIIYDLDRFSRTQHADPTEPTNWLPAYAATLARETHASDPVLLGGVKIQAGFSYSDGFGREIQKKIQAEPGPVVEGEMVATPRWVGSGWTIFNNKGKPVRQYEPFFSQLAARRHHFEFGVRVGVSPVLFYDPIGRVVAAIHANHTWEKVVFDPWRQESWDVNDTVLLHPKTDRDVKDFFLRLPNQDYMPTWHGLRTYPAFALEFAQHWPDQELRDAETGAATKAAKLANTPTLAFFDSLGRTFLIVAHNRRPSHAAEAGSDKEEFYSNAIVFDIEGNQREVIDVKTRVVMRYDYDMVGDRIHQTSMETGERWMLNDVAGRPIHAWDSRGFHRQVTYDSLRRPTGLIVNGNGLDKVLTEKTVYGDDPQEGPQNPEATNRRGKVYQVYDSAGLVTSVEYDFKGNLLRSTRQLLKNYREQVNWNHGPALEEEVFTASSRFDAMNRVVQHVAPHSSRVGTKPNIIQPTYNEANLLEELDTWLQQDSEPAGLLTANAAASHVITNIDYNAKGQRILIDYANGAETTYEYDAQTFRLIHLKTTRAPGQDGPLSKIFNSAATVQDLHYTYDPAGNITRIEEAALKSIFFNQQKVEVACDYTYDAIYQLIEATGREHIGQMAFGFTPPFGNRRDYAFMGLSAHPNDLQAMRRYTESYEYDAAGNFLLMRHIANGGSWTRDYDYAAASLLEPLKQSNRLTQTKIGSGLNFSETYTYVNAQGNDVHACMTAMNSMQMDWDFKDQLCKVDLGGGGVAYYVYNAGGQRVRKMIENQNGTLSAQRLYLGGFEIFSNFNANALIRETLHIMDDKQRIAVVETEMLEGGSRISNIRYQLGNHLGSACLELDKDGGLISYEEYHPYGASSLQAIVGAAEVSLKRFRYNGKERDEESGLYYCGARYYSSWLGRWTSPDPAGIVDGSNLYRYVQGNPIRLRDPTGTSSIKLPEERSELRDGAPLIRLEAPRAPPRRTAPRKPEVSEIQPEAPQSPGEPASPTLSTEQEENRPESIRIGVTTVEHVRPKAATISDAAADIVLGSAEKTAATIAGIGTTLLLNALTLGGYSTYAIANHLWEGHNDGGTVGVFLAASEIFNPLYRVGVAVEKTAKAIEQGDAKALGREGTGAQIEIGQLVAAVVGEPELPAWRKGQPTRGVLDTGRAIIELSSSRKGPGGGPGSGGMGPLPLPGRTNQNFFHVESQAAQIMRLEGLEDATLYINRAPCLVKPGCANNLRHMLPEGAVLRVIGPDGYYREFVGSPDPPSYP